MSDLLTVNRRSFVKAAGLTAAGMAAVGAAQTAAADEQNAVEDVAGVSEASFPSWAGEPPVIDESEIAQTVEVDLVVVGGGNAGIMCATAAAEEGLTVAVIESQSEEGIIYYGLHDIGCVNSQYCLDRGVAEIKKSEFIAEFQRRSHNRTNPALIRQFAENSGEMLDWLIERAPQEVLDAVHIENIDSNDAYFDALGGELNAFKCWRGCVQLDFQTLAPVLIEQAEASGATWYWEHTGVVLCSEQYESPCKRLALSEDGTLLVEEDATETRTRVTGVIATDPDGNYIKFVGARGIVLACGDYGQNPEMYAALQDEQRWLYESHGLDTSSLTCASFGRDGSGIKMGIWVGGSVDPCPRTLVSPQVMFSSDDFPTNVLRWGSGFKMTPKDLPNGAGGAGQNPWGAPFVCVGEDGKRFTDETFLGIFGQMQRVERRKPGRYFFFFDNKWKELMSRMAPEHFSQPVGVSNSVDYDELFNSWVERGAQGAEPSDNGVVCAWGANSLEELFDYMGFDDEMKESVQAEIERYNGFCAQGDDEDFGRDPNMLLDISEPPFFGMYSVEEKPMVGTCALNGLVIGDDQHVLDKNYNPIDGLYATGNNSGGRFAIEYSTPIVGLTLGLAMALGRVLGKQIAAQEA